MGGEKQNQSTNQLTKKQTTTTKTLTDQSSKSAILHQQMKPEWLASLSSDLTKQRERCESNSAVCFLSTLRWNDNKLKHPLRIKDFKI